MIGLLFENASSKGLETNPFNDLFLSASMMLIFCLGFFESYVLISLKIAELNTAYLIVQCAKFGALGFVLYFFLFPRRWKFSLHPAVIAILVLLFVYVGVALGNQDVVRSNILLNIKNHYLWIVLLLIIGYSSRRIPRGFIWSMLISSVALGFLNIGYSLIVNFFYDGSPREFYFYELYNRMNMYADANFVRHGNIRSFGLVGSCLSLSQIIIIPMSFVIALIVEGRWRFLTVAMALGLVIGEWITRTRNPSMAMLIALISFVLLRRTRRLWSVVVFVCGYLVVSFYYIFQQSFSEASKLDLSALNRGIQLLKISEALLHRPLGYGIGYAGVANDAYAVWTDLSFGTILLELGVLPVVLLVGGAFRLLRFSSYSMGGYEEEVRVSTTTFFFLCVSLLVLSEYSNIFDGTLLSFSIAMGTILNRIRNCEVIS